MAKNETSALAKQLWGLAIAQGVIAVLFGILALFWPGLTTALLIVFFGVFVLVWGVVGIIVSLATSASNGLWWLELIFSVAAVGVAVYMLRNIDVVAAFFAILIGLTFLVRGVIDFLEGLFDRNRSSDARLFSILAGILGFLAGIALLVYPVAAGIGVVWVIGLYAVLYGSLSIAFALRAQKELQ